MDPSKNHNIRHGSMTNHKILRGCMKNQKIRHGAMQNHKIQHESMKNRGNAGLLGQGFWAVVKKIKKRLDDETTRKRVDRGF